MKYIAYYRVSTKKQGNSGLGLEAQRTAVESYLKDKIIMAEYTDIESGTKKGNDRENLKQAVIHAKSSNAILIIAKLDRLARNVSFITTLMESGIEFIACDMPQANKFTIHIFAALAEQEADLISQRTKSALAELKAKGVKLGNPQNLTKKARIKGLKIRQQNALENENNIKSTALIVSLKKEGMSFYAIAQKLNELKFKTRNGNIFKDVQVKLLFDRYTSNKKAK
ncbi:MAG: recombinase family protein [Bacteroidia bacterium]|nr:recombinase family protein [Bacteroidia bacterium]